MQSYISNTYNFSIDKKIVEYNSWNEILPGVSYLWNQSKEFYENHRNIKL